MKKFTWGFVAMALVATAYLGVPSSAQVKKGKERVLQTKNWMSGVNLPHCSALGEMLKAGISEEKAWSEAVQHAEVLNESGHVLMTDSRCPDKVWADAATQLRDGSAAMIAALGAKNSTDAKSAFEGQVLKACSNCHAVHKK